MKPSIFTLIIVVILVAGCRRGHDLSQTQIADINSDVRLVLNLMSDSVRANGLTGWIPFLHNSTDFKWEYRGTTSSYDELVAGIRHDANQHRSIIVKWDSLQVEPIDENEATLFAKYNEIIVDTAGVRSDFTGTLKGQLARIDGSWKIHNGQTFDNILSQNK